MPLPSQKAAPGAHWVKREQAELLADLAVVALLRFLDLMQVLLEIVFLEERRAVDPLHRLVARVALPVRVRRVSSLNAFNRAGGRHVRADAEVDERVAVLDGVAGDFRLACGLLLDQLDLERLAALREELDRFLARPHLPLVGQVGRRQLAHLRFDFLEVLRHERTRDDEVVEEALVGGRADAALHAGEEIGHRGGEQMRGRVAIERQRLGPVGRDDLEPRVLVERRGQIDQLAVQRAASAFFITLCGSVEAAKSRTGVPRGTLRWDPSGSVRVTFDTLGLVGSRGTSTRVHDSARSGGVEW